MFDFGPVITGLATVATAGFAWIEPTGFIGAVVSLGIVGTAVFGFIGGWVRFGKGGKRRRR